MAEPVTSASVMAKQEEVKNLARKLAEAATDLARMTARHSLDSALDEQEIKPAEVAPKGSPK